MQRLKRFPMGAKGTPLNNSVSKRSIPRENTELFRVGRGYVLEIVQEHHERGLLWGLRTAFFNAKSSLMGQESSEDGEE
jgi:hypothetical protein